MPLRTEPAGRVQSLTPRCRSLSNAASALVTALPCPARAARSPAWPRGAAGGLTSAAPGRLPSPRPGEWSPQARSPAPRHPDTAKAPRLPKTPTGGRGRRTGPEAADFRAWGRGCADFRARGAWRAVLLPGPEAGPRSSAELDAADFSCELAVQALNGGILGEPREVVDHVTAVTAHLPPNHPGTPERSWRRGGGSGAGGGERGAGVCAVAAAGCGGPAPAWEENDSHLRLRKPFKTRKIKRT